METFARGKTSASGPTPRDRTRQRVVLGSAVLALVVSTIGSGALGGTPIDEAADGTLSATATLVAPAGPAFSIWGVIYAGLVAHGVWQLAAARPADPRQRSVGWLLAASMLLNAAWITVVQLGSVTLSVLVIVALVAVLGVVLARLARSSPSGWAEALLVDGVAGLYLGWVLIATVADVSAWLSGLGVGGLGLGESAWAVVVLAVAAAIGAWLSLASGRVAPALSLGWGLAWVAVGRSSGEDSSGVVVVVAALAALVVLAAGVTGCVRGRRSAPSRPARIV